MTRCLTADPAVRLTIPDVMAVLSSISRFTGCGSSPAGDFDTDCAAAAVDVGPTVYSSSSLSSSSSPPVPPLPIAAATAIAAAAAATPPSGSPSHGSPLFDVLDIVEGLEAVAVPRDVVDAVCDAIGHKAVTTLDALIANGVSGLTMMAVRKRLRTVTESAVVQVWTRRGLAPHGTRHPTHCSLSTTHDTQHTTRDTVHTAHNVNVLVGVAGVSRCGCQVTRTCHPRETSGRRAAASWPVGSWTPTKPCMRLR